MDIPDNSRRILTTDQLPDYWQENTYTKSQTILADWLAKPDVMAMSVPSSIMPDGVNYLLNPAHADYHHIQLVEEKALVIGSRLRH